MGLYESAKTSPALERNGIWLELERFDTCIKIARAGGANVRYLAAAERIGRENKRAIDLGMMTLAKDRKIAFDLYADHVILDWLTRVPDGDLDCNGEPIADPAFDGNRYVRGIGRPGGKIVEPTKENIVQTLNDIDILFPIIKDTAEGNAGFLESLVEDRKGN